MATGSLDSVGVWLYGEDDERDTFSELLNIGQEATSDAIAADRARLTAIEGAALVSSVFAAGLVASSGWSIITQEVRSKAGVVFFRARFSRSGGAITVPSDGNIANQLVATFAAGWVPASGMRYAATSAETGPLATGWADNTGLYLAAVQGGSSILTSSEFSLLGTYPL